MRQHNIWLNTLVVFILVVFLMACLPGPAPLTQSEPLVTAAPKLPSRANWDSLVSEARKDGKVVLYGSGSGDTAGELTKAFKNRYGIDLEFLQGRGQEILEKLLRERQAGLYLADVGIGSPGPFFNIVEPANIAIPLEPLLVQEEVKDPTKWRSGKMPFLDEKKALVALVGMVMPLITINTTMASENEITSFDDVLAPKWKGKIVINDPGLLGPGTQWFTYVMQYYGKDKGADYMKKLVRQEPMISRDERLVIEWIAKGKYVFGLGAKQTVVTSFINVGAPLKFVTVKEGAPVSSGVLNFNVFDKSAHPRATQLFMNWIVTKEAGEIMARTSGYPSERADVSRQSFEPAFVPGPNDVLAGKEHYLAQGQMLRVSAETFKELLK